MHEFAQLAVRTETSQVVGAKHTTDVTMATMWTVSTESTIIPRTVLNLALRVDVQERAFLVVARVESRIEVALGHLGHVVLVEELTLIALFAETS